MIPIDTPILDRKRPLPRNLWAGDGRLKAFDYLILFGFMLFAGVGIVAVLVYFPETGVQLKKLERFMPPMGPEESPYLVPLYPFTFFAVMFLVVLVHELGHALVGLVVGLRLRSILIYPLMLTLDPKRRIQLVKQAEVLGLVLFDHSDMSDFSRRYGLMIAGGPLANLATAAITYPFWKHSDHFLHWFLGVLGVYSCFIGIVNLLPFAAATFSSDGSKLRMLAVQPARLLRFKALLQLQEMVRAGLPPADWSPEIVEQITSAGAEKTPEKYHLFWLGYCWFSNREDAEHAGMCVERCLQALNRAGPATREQMKVEATIFHAWHRRDLSAAEAWSAMIKAPEKLGSFNPQRLKIALGCARGDYVTAIAETSAIIASLEKLEPSPARDLLHRGWSDWQAKIEKRASQAAHA